MPSHRILIKFAIPALIEHWKKTGGVEIVVRDAMHDALRPDEKRQLMKAEAQEVLIYQDYQLTLIRGAVSTLLSALDVLGQPDAEEWLHIKAQAEVLRQIADSR